jgi:hypothetical protein
VAADYRINTYFRDPSGVYINLYIPSTLQWTQGNAHVSLTQKSQYPFDSLVQFEVATSKKSEFAMHLRIPDWAEGASVAVNGKRATADVAPGRFVTIRRRWKAGDRIELDLPTRLRLEPIDARHPQTVALLCGPLVLFAITKAPPNVTSRQLLAAKKTAEEEWQVETATGPMSMLPFSGISDQQYSTYLVAG